jgi:type II secretory pathway component PulK
VLLSVLVVIVLLTLAAYQFSELMMAEYHASVSYAKTLQTKALADSGINYTAAALADPNAFANLISSNPFDNPGAFQDVAVGGDPNNPDLPQGRFSIVALNYQDDPNFSSNPWRYGVSDESGKINLNALMELDTTGNIAQQMLMTLPNMTEDIANSILDWIDPDDTPRANGAESDYYGSLSPPYQAKNGPLDSIEELLLVKGVTAQLLFGNDRNRNGILDPGEDDNSGQFDRGWSAYLTVYSREPNVDINGNPRIYVNDADVNNLSNNLTGVVGSDLANFIVAYRMYGPASTGTTTPTPGKSSTPDPKNNNNTKTMTASPPTASGPMGTSGKFTPASASDKQAFTTKLNSDKQNAGNRRLTPISSLFSLVNAKVSVTTGTGPSAKTVTIPSPLSDPGQLPTLLPLVLDELTTVNSPDLPARINVNTASQTVLLSLPGLQQSDVTTIMNSRPDPTTMSAPDPVFQTPAWLMINANISATTMQALERYLTARGQVYRFQAIGYFDANGPASRIEAVVDTNNGRPRIVYYRDLTSLGKGFDLSSGNSTNNGSSTNNGNN